LDDKGNWVPGDLLAVVWSRDLADKKAALIDATIDLRRDSARLKELEVLYFERGSISGATYYELQRTVQKDMSARNAAERILRVWKLSNKEIADLKKEAETIEADKRDPEVEKEWARVEVRALNDGVIVEKNTHVGDWVDPANYGTPMYRIADLTKLQVWLNPAEEFLSSLQAFLKKEKPAPLDWDIRLQSDPKEPLSGELLRIGTTIDQNQHTPLLVGLVDNPGDKLLIGQFVTAVIRVPLEDDVVEIPTNALNEDKGQSVVFVQGESKDANKVEFTMRAVDVVHRFRDVVYVRSKDAKPPAETTPDMLPVKALQPGDRIVTESVVELTKVLRDLRSKEKLKQK
jgi:cobalt-zinc-cadmium efflux system membrane fusion protein